MAADLVGEVPPMLDERTSAADALQRMLAGGCSCVFVLRGERLAGLVTERDFLRLLVGGGDTASATVEDAEGSLGEGCA